MVEIGIDAGDRVRILRKLLNGRPNIVIISNDIGAVQDVVGFGTKQGQRLVKAHINRIEHCIIDHPIYAGTVCLFQLPGTLRKSKETKTGKVVFDRQFIQMRAISCISGTSPGSKMPNNKRPS